MASFDSRTANAALVADSDNMFVFVPNSSERGNLLYTRDGALLSQEFDTDKLQMTGPAVGIAEDVESFDASKNVLIYHSGRIETSSRLVWFDRRGKETGAMGEAGQFGDVFLSRDGKTALVDRVDSGIAHAWLGDTSRGVFSRITSGDANETAGNIFNDGAAVFTSNAGGSHGELYAVRANGSGQPELLVKSEFLDHANDISPDGKYLIYDEHGTQRQDLFVVPMEGAAGNRKPIPFLVTQADETLAQFSPDGKWIAYSSDESSRREVYVRAFLPQSVPCAGTRKWVISTAGGDKPRWSRNGKELFYISLDGKMTAVPVKLGDTFEPGIPVPLFEVHANGYVPYDVSPDGRFLINVRLAAAQPVSTLLTVVLNWTASLKH
jgi:Tol biopolymer transport system component